MSMLHLSREGIFPLANAATGFNLAGTVQGEGKWAGTPSLFVRTQGCNLRCIWTDENGRAQTCDTAHTSFFASEAMHMAVEDVFSTIKANCGKIRHVVITGGEPLLQAREVAQLLQMLRTDGFKTTLETNGTIFCQEAIEQCSLVSISPKLPSSFPTKQKLQQLGLSESDVTRNHSRIALNLSVLQQIIDCAKAAGGIVQLKFVVSSPGDESEIAKIVNNLHGIDNEDVMLMPMGIDHAAMQRNGLIATQIAIRNGWRFSPRLHIELFGNKEGV